MEDINLKKEFIKYFGKKKWEEEEILSLLNEIGYALAKYLEVSPIPVVTEKMEEDSRFYTKELYIAISDVLISDFTESLKCLIHEYRHYKQLMCVTQKITTEPNYESWKEDLRIINQIRDPADTMCLSVEIDAYAFTKYLMDKWFNIEIIHYDPLYEEILIRYIKKNFN